MPKIDVQFYHLIRFVLPKACNGTLDVEISAEYGILHENTSIVIVTVYAQVEACKVKGYLYTDEISKEALDRDGYTAISEAILKNQEFTKTLKSFLDWSAQSGIICV